VKKVLSAIDLRSR